MQLALALLAVASPVDSLSIGASEKDVTEAFRRSGVPIQWVDAAESQALRRTLIEAGLLEALNRSGAAPKRKDGAFDFSAFHRFGIAEREAHAHLAVMAGGRLRFLLVVRRVPVDPSKDRDGWSEARLHRLKSALAELAPYELEPAERDRWGNAFGWKGRKGRDRLAVWYRPERDELRLLLH